MLFDQWLELMTPELRIMHAKSYPAPPPEKERWRHEQIGDTHLVFLDPLDLKLIVRNTRGVDVPEDNYVNASFVWWEDFPKNTKPYPTSMLVSDGTLINNKQPNGFWVGEYAGKGVPTPTFVIYKDGSVDMVTTNDLSIIRHSIHLAVTIVQSNPDVNKQGFVPYVSWSSIDYAANRIGIFYRAADNKVILVFRPNTTMERLRTTGINIGANFGGAMDSGGSGNFKVGGKAINLTIRWMCAGLTWG